jgi:hypothetical protein
LNRLSLRLQGGVRKEKYVSQAVEQKGFLIIKLL